MSLCLETGCTHLNKHGEELCGDNVERMTNGEYTTLVLADGLGSGVKANILATLTSKILCTMIANDVDIEECIETIICSLPVCKVRGVAYATFSVIHINEEGEGFLFEFDNPPAIYIHDGKCAELEREKLVILDRTVYKSELKLQENDMLVVMSDGVIYAGIGMLMNFGWQRPEVIEYLNKNVTSEMSARGVACLVAGACNDLYLDKPGDDTTVAAVKVRKKLSVNVMVGPPVDKDKDDFYVARFLAGEGKKVVCGGTSSQIVARYLKKPVRTSFDFIDKDVPPIGYIEGMDLTTEGVITLRKLLELSEKYLSETDLTPKSFKKKDGASLLAKILFEEGTDITFFVGQSINAAHQGLPIDTTMKLKLIENLAARLKAMGKRVTLNYD